MPKDAAGHLIPGRPSPTRAVPASIARPEYVGRHAPAENLAGDTYTPDEVERIRAAGRIAARAIDAAASAIRPGVTTDELDRIAHEYVVAHGAYPSTLGYRGYPKSSCTSVNEVICHGIPDDTVLDDGDLVNIDVTAYLDGYHGDLNHTFLVGAASASRHPRGRSAPRARRPPCSSSAPARRSPAASARSLPVDS